jgi:hypothetical protein
MQPHDDQLSRLMNSAAQPSANEALPPVLTQQMEDAVIRAWRSARARTVRGWFDGFLAPGLAVAGAAMALAVFLNFQEITDLRDNAQNSDLELMIADSSTQLALLP